MNETEDLNETSELQDCIRKLSSVQSRLKFLIEFFDIVEDRKEDLPKIYTRCPEEKRCVQEVLDLTTHVRNHIQNNFQKLRIGLDS
jgi:hypothetical protein